MQVALPYSFTTGSHGSNTHYYRTVHFWCISFSEQLPHLQSANEFAEQERFQGRHAPRALRKAYGGGSVTTAGGFISPVIVVEALFFFS